MNNLINTKPLGIKCDNTDCDYKDPSVTFEELEDWVDKPCPKCSHNLLIKADYQLVKNIHAMIDAVNNDPELKKMSEGYTEEDKVTIRAEFNGTGKANFKLVE